MYIYSSEFNESKANNEDQFKQYNPLMIFFTNIIMIILIYVALGFPMTYLMFDDNNFNKKVDSLLVSIFAVIQTIVLIKGIIIYYAYINTSKLILLFQISIHSIPFIILIRFEKSTKPIKRPTEYDQDLNTKIMIIAHIFLIILLLASICAQYYIKDNKKNDNIIKGTFFSLNLKFVKYQPLTEIDFIITYILILFIIIFTTIQIILFYNDDEETIRHKPVIQKIVNQQIGVDQFITTIIIYTPIFMALHFALFMSYYSKDSILLTLFIISFVSLIELLILAIIYYYAFRKLITNKEPDETRDLDLNIFAVVALIIILAHLLICEAKYQISV